MMKRRIVCAATALAGVVLTASSALAQEPAGRAGWTFIPRFSFTETHDDNITLFGHGTAEAKNDDLITSYTPQAELTFRGRRTRVGSSYSGSLLTYRNFSLFNRWDQYAQVHLQRAETMRLGWSLQGSASMRPSTDAIDFDGIRFSATGAKMLTGRAGVSYQLGGRDSMSTAVDMQKIEFERPGDLRPFLRGGRSAESFTTYRRRVNSRLAVGGSYSLRLASTAGENRHVTFQRGRAALDYQLSRAWTLNADGGIDYVMATTESPSQRAPGFSVSANRSEGSRRFYVGYQRRFLPSFGFGGAIQGQELGVSYSTPISASRRLYMDHGATLRDSRPLIEAPGRLRLRSLRTTSVVGWAPQRWARIEAFYTRLHQTTLIPGGVIDRNRIGFQIVTSRPVRVQ
jgi:hypothetical protein